MAFNAYMYDKGLLGSKEKNLPCFFIDNSLNHAEQFEESTDEEKSAYHQSIESIKTWLSGLPKFEFRDMQTVQLVIQKLQSEKEDAIQAAIVAKQKSKDALAHALAMIEQTKKQIQTIYENI